MNEGLLMLIYFAGFCIVSYLFLRIAYRLEKWTLWITVPLYFFVSIFLYYGGVDSLNEKLKETEYYIYWGHASLGLVLLILASFFVGLVSVGILLYKKFTTRRKF